jgi:aminopeptidase
VRTTKDPRLKDFAHIIVERGAEVDKGDNVYMVANSMESLPLFREMRRQVIQKGGQPHEHFLFDSQVGSEGMDYDFMKHASMEQIKSVSEAKRQEMKLMDGYINIGGPSNIQDLSGVRSKKVSARRKSTREIMDIRFGTKWAATRYPTEGMAQNADMSTAELEKLIFEAVVKVDYEEMERKNARIKEEFDSSEEIQIKDRNTDLRFSIKNREGRSSHGRRNFPDGEVFYAPVKDSVEGKIMFSHPAAYSGGLIHGVKLWFEDGQIVDFSAERNEELLESMIDTDEGSRYLGEFGIGTNRRVTRNVNNTIPDEKIGGSIHLAIGNAYEETVPNSEERNKSGIHQDIVFDMRPRAGGGKIVLDGETVQKDGEWRFSVD